MLWLICLLEGLSPPSSGRLITVHDGFSACAHRCGHRQLPLGIAASASTSIFILPGAGQMGITSVLVQICGCELTSKFKKNRFSHFLLHKCYVKVYFKKFPNEKDQKVISPAFDDSQSHTKCKSRRFIVLNADGKGCFFFFREQRSCPCEPPSC